jgi:hypothetical protein
MKLEEMMPDTDTVVRHEIDRRLLDVLVCPLTRGPLVYDRANNELISHQARKAYPVRAGVPIMLVDEARDLVGDE